MLGGEAAGSRGAVKAVRMENDAPVVGPDAPTANPRWSNWTLRPRAGVGQLPVARDTIQNNRNSAIRSLLEWAIRRQEPPGERSENRAALPHEGPPALGGCSALLGRRERTDRNVISVRISERELLGLSVRVHVWLLFEPSDERACPLKRQVEIIDTEEQQEPVAGCPVIGAHQ